MDLSRWGPRVQVFFRGVEVRATVHNAGQSKHEPKTLEMRFQQCIESNPAAVRSARLRRPLPIVTADRASWIRSFLAALSVSAECTLVTCARPFVISARKILLRLQVASPRARPSGIFPDNWRIKFIGAVVDVT